MNCTKLSKEELNRTIDYLRQLRSEVQEIKNALNHTTAAGRMKRDVAPPAKPTNCSLVFAYIDTMAALVEADEYVKALTYTQPIKEGLIAFNGCPARANAMLYVLQR